MEDSQAELRRHLPIWREGRGRILITGLGLGCVVRALLTKSEVEHIDVIEKDPEIAARVGFEYHREPRVALHLGDAFTFDAGGRIWDYAAHDIWDEKESVPLLHTKLIEKYLPSCRQQTAWGMPAIFWEKIGSQFVSNLNI